VAVNQCPPALIAQLGGALGRWRPCR
jgi:hypothetical protein